MLSTMGLTNLNIIGNSVDVIKLTPKLILLGLKPRRANHALIPSSTPIAKETTKPIQIPVYFGDTTSTGNGTSKNMPRSVKTDHNLPALK